MNMDTYQLARATFDEYAGLDAPRLPIFSMGVSALQVRLARWMHANFKATGIELLALGVNEELGELAEMVIGMVPPAGRLAHSVLKWRNHHRGFDMDGEKLRANAADAIADLIIFAIQACTVMRIDFGALLEATVEEVTKRDWVKDPDGGGLRR